MEWIIEYELNGETIIETFTTEKDFDNRWCELHFNPIYNVVNTTSGSNA